MIDDNKTKFGVELEDFSDKTADEKPKSFGEWLKLGFSEEKNQKLADVILKEIDSMLDERRSAGWDENVIVYRNQYEGVVAETSIPFTGCFNLNVPITTKYQDACVSQTEEAFEDVDPKWTIELPHNKSQEGYCEIQEKILDHYSDTEMEDDDVWSMIYHDAFLLPCGWGGMTYEREIERIRIKKTFTELKSFIREYPDDYQKYPQYVDRLMKGEKVELIAEYNQEMSRSPKAQHYEWEDIVVPLKTDGLKGMKKAKIIARRVWMKWTDIASLEQDGDYLAGVSNTLQYKTLNADQLTPDPDPEYKNKDYETWEVIYLLDVDDDDQEERCMFNIESEHRLMMRSIRYPFDHNRPYIIPYYIQKTRAGIYQPALGEKLMHINIAANATLNNTLNASVIANSLSLKVRQGSDAVRALYEHRWYPGSVLELMNMDDVEQFIFSTPNLAGLISLFSIIERLGEDVSGILNYQVGKESPDDPNAPASKAIALMRKAEIKLRRYIKSLKRSNDEMGYQALRLIYQYTPKSRLAEILGVEEKDVPDYVNLPLKCKTQSTGFALEKLFAKRDNQQMASMIMADPIIQGNPVKRVQVYEMLAKEHGSNWDKKLRKIISVDEVKQMLEQQKQDQNRKRMEVGKRAASEIYARTKNQDEAKKAAIDAMAKYDNMMKAAEQPQPAQGGKSGAK